MGTFITRLTPAGSGIRLAVKDLIDLAGVPTTAGSRALAETALPAGEDAPCLAGARAAGAAIVGKANLVELAFGASGINDWFGTPVNPLDPDLMPGGSSSGSAVAVADGDADVAYGSDTGGSIRVPAAFCGITGLKTTYGRVSLTGVWPLAPSLDTVGPMARDVAGLAAGMALLEPGFTVDAAPAVLAARIRPSGVDVDPDIDAAVDAALARSGLEVVAATPSAGMALSAGMGLSAGTAPPDGTALPAWTAAREACGTIIDAEAARANRVLFTDPVRRSQLSEKIRARLDGGAAISAAEVAQARQFQALWGTTLAAAMGEADVLVLPTVPIYAPPLTALGVHPFTALTNPVNLSGCPAIALPVPSARRLPASLQLIGRPGSEALLLATAAVIEAAAGYRRD